MKSKIQKLIALAVFAILLQGCATSEMDQKIDHELRREQAIQKIEDLDQYAQGVLEQNRWLSSAQRRRLESVRIFASERIRDLSVQALQVRALLIEVAVSRSENRQEMLALADRLREIERLQFIAVWQAVDETNAILGRNRNNRSMDAKTFASAPGN